MYAPKDKTCLIPMVMDQNPALPNMGSIIHKYKHLLDLDPALKKLVRADSVFVSHRKIKTIGGMLVSLYTISTVLVELQAVIRRETPLLVSFLDQTLQFCRLFGRLTTQGAMTVENAMFVSKDSCPPKYFVYCTCNVIVKFFFKICF